jgi:uncharacterized protein (TIGR03067 family)
MRTHTVLPAALWAATIVALPAAAAADEPAPAGDLAKLQGQWTAMFGPQKDIPLVVTIRGSGVTISITRPDAPTRESKGEIKIDEAAKPYKTIDWINFKGPEGNAAPANRGIYTLNGDSITVCNGGPGNPRPTEFKAGDGGPPQLLVLNRKGGPAAAAGDLAGDQAKIQGRWGAKVGAQKNISIVLTIQGTGATLTMSGPNGQRDSKGEIKIDETARPNKTFDWVNFTTPAGETVPTNKGIYKLEGDTLTICSGGIGGDRPTEFKAGEANKPSLIVLTRE